MGSPMTRGSGELLIFGVFDELEVGAADKLFFPAGGIFEEDNVDIVEGGEFFLDRPDELFVPDADPLSLSKIHDKRLGCGGGYPLSQERVSGRAKTVTMFLKRRCRGWCRSLDQKQLQGAGGSGPGVEIAPREG